MKKSLLFSLLVIGFSVAGFAQHHHHHHDDNYSNQNRNQYYYYPEANVYYYPVSSSYIFNDHHGWQTARVLPRNFRFNNSMRSVLISYSGRNIWQDNHHHISNYRGPNNRHNNHDSYGNNNYKNDQPMSDPHSNKVSRRQHRIEHRQQRTYNDHRY